MKKTSVTSMISPSSKSWENTDSSKRGYFRKLILDLLRCYSIFRSAPVWAEHPTTFDAQIHSRVGKGIKYINGLDQHLFETLSKEISVWFPVQTAVLPKLVGDDSLHDVAISAPTGSGKTFCYLIPILNQFMCGWKSKYIMALVLAPTRTLIRQISRVNKHLTVNLSYSCISGVQPI